jgi:hypothetical protein
LVLRLRGGWIFHVLFQLSLLTLVVDHLLTVGRSGSPPSGGSAESEESLGSPLLSSGRAWLLIVGALFLDFIHLLSVGRYYSLDSYQGTDPGFFPAVWAAFAVMLGAASLLGRPRGTAGQSLAFFAVMAPHLALTILGQDLFSARAQVAVLLLWTMLFGGGFWPRAAVLALAALYLPAERALSGTGLFDAFSPLDWLNPLSGPLKALDLTLKDAAALSSGTWGLGPQYLGRLDFVIPGLMRLNALPYLTALGGRGGVIIYAAVALSLLVALGWLATSSRPPRRAASLLPAWLLVASNQYLALVFFLGWRTVGLTHPPAFLGGAGTGLEILALAVLAIPAEKEPDLPAPFTPFPKPDRPEPEKPEPEKLEPPKLELSKVEPSMPEKPEAAPEPPPDGGS